MRFRFLEGRHDKTTANGECQSRPGVGSGSDARRGSGAASPTSSSEALWQDEDVLVYGVNRLKGHQQPGLHRKHGRCNLKRLIVSDTRRARGRQSHSDVSLQDLTGNVLVRSAADDTRAAAASGISSCLGPGSTRLWWGATGARRVKHVGVIA